LKNKNRSNVKNILIFLKNIKIFIYLCQSITKPKTLMKKLYLFLVLIVVYSFLAGAMKNKISKEKLEGKWNVKVVDAPSGYQDYIIEIKDDKGEYKADITFVEFNSKISNQKLTLKDGKLTGNVYVDNERVELTIWEEKGVVQGTAKSPSIGTLSLTFARPKD
jgi:hypothetical protein